MKTGAEDSTMRGFRIRWLAPGLLALVAACGGEAYEEVQEPNPALTAEEVAEDSQWAGPANDEAPPASVIYGDEEMGPEAPAVGEAPAIEPRPE